MIKRIILVISIFLIANLAYAELLKKDCAILFAKNNVCQLKGLDVELISEKIADDEIKLTTLKVIHKGVEQLLSITKDTTFIDGDKGVILFQDINFDSYPDLAVSTSFGVANNYMDYWVYDLASNKYTYAGNHVRFEINNNEKTVSNTVKLNAAKYINNVYKWDGIKLVTVN